MLLLGCGERGDGMTKQLGGMGNQYGRKEERTKIGTEGT
jgi:hypothetical protein